MMLLLKEKVVLTMTLALLIFGTSDVLAQQLSSEEKARRMTEAMTKKLELSPEQKKEAYDVNFKLLEKERELLLDEEVDYFDRLEKLRAIGDERDKMLKKVFDRNQYKKYMAIKNKTQDNG